MTKYFFIGIVLTAWVYFNATTGLDIPVEEKSAFNSHHVLGRRVADWYEGERVIVGAQVLIIIIIGIFHDERQ